MGLVNSACACSVSLSQSFCALNVLLALAPCITNWIYAVHGIQLFDIKSFASDYSLYIWYSTIWYSMLCLWLLSAESFASCGITKHFPLAYISDIYFTDLTLALSNRTPLKHINTVQPSKTILYASPLLSPLPTLRWLMCNYCITIQPDHDCELLLFVLDFRNLMAQMAYHAICTGPSFLINIFLRATL